MLAQRLIVAILLIPAGILVITSGGWILAAVVIAVLGYGAWEYCRLFNQGGYHPSAPLLIAGVIGLALARQMFQFTGSDLILSSLVMVTMGVQVVQLEKRGNNSAAGF